MSIDGLVGVVSKMTGYSRSVVREVMGELLKTIQDQVKLGNKVKLANFGTFETVLRAARKGRNPYSGESIDIPALLLPKFRSSRTWKQSVSKKKSKVATKKKLRGIG